MRFRLLTFCWGFVVGGGISPTLASAESLGRVPHRNPGYSEANVLYGPRDVRAPTCAQRPPESLQAAKANIWYGLSTEEVSSVTSWLLDQKQLNLTAAEGATSWDNCIDFMQLLMPNKTDALAYMDGNGREPARYAQVSLNIRATDSPTFTEIMVGPLPISQKATWEYLSYPYSKKRKGSIRNTNADDMTLYLDWLAVIGANISDITLALWNKTATGAANDTLLIYGMLFPVLL